MANTVLFQHPKKWRDTCDLFALNFHTFHPIEVLGYPHAGNDVFHVKGTYEGKEITAYVKVARQESAGIENEVIIQKQLDLPYIPKILDADFQDVPFVVTSEMSGHRLSVILGDNKDGTALSYMEEYGETLGYIHTLKPNAAPVSDRKFFHLPADDAFEKLDIAFLKPYFENIPSDKTTVFTHGDFHYANILWEEHHISAVLDFELSGYGNRDFDIAWALILRPGQKFLKTQEEQQQFLKGYCKYGSYNAHAVQYYMAQIYVYFLQLCGDDSTYVKYVKWWLEENCITS